MGVARRVVDGLVRAGPQAGSEARGALSSLTIGLEDGVSEDGSECCLGSFMVRWRCSSRGLVSLGLGKRAAPSAGLGCNAGFPVGDFAYTVSGNFHALCESVW